MFYDVILKKPILTLRQSIKFAAPRVDESASQAMPGVAYCYVSILIEVRDV